jgi:hypothetical protein
MLDRRKRRLLGLVLILLLSFTIRGLTARFLADHFTDPGWFQSGSFSVFDTEAQEILDGKESWFRIPDNTRTDLIQYPPAYRVMVAAIYAATGERTAYAVQRVQWMLDSLSVLLIVGIAVTAFGWPTGIASGFLAALSPLLAFQGATPTADSPASWIVLGSIWMLLLAAKRLSWRWALGAGAMLGLACWFRVNPLLLAFLWAAALVWGIRAEGWARAAKLGVLVAVTTLVVISPVVIRNLVVFYPQFAPTGLNVGWNLWAGIGETDRAEEFNAPCCDVLVVAQEKKEMGLPPDAPLGLCYPDGIRRDKERGRKAMAVILHHPFWYSTVMVRRMWGMVKFAGTPSPIYGSPGINVTPSKTLPDRWRGGVSSAFVTVLGMVQSLVRYLALPLMIVGAVIAWRREWLMAWLLLATVFYYLVIGSGAHTEIRYTLPMQGVLFVFAGVAVMWVFGVCSTAIRRNLTKDAS